MVTNKGAVRKNGEGKNSFEWKHKTKVCLVSLPSSLKYLINAKQTNKQKKLSCFGSDPWCSRSIISNEALMNFSKLKVSKNIKPHACTHTHTQINKHTRWQHELEPAETHNS